VKIPGSTRPPRIHGELLKLGIEIGQTSVAKYMARRRGPPSPRWKTFLRNHAAGIVAMDLFVVPTISFRLLYGFVIVRLDRRALVWINVTTNPTAEWVCRMRQSLARYSAPVSSVHAPSWADFITTMVGFRVFGTHTYAPCVHSSINS
jgi:hypothetical protein